VHLVDSMLLPAPYSARPYRGAADHPAMTAVLAAYRAHIGDPEMPSVGSMDTAYAHLRNCDPQTDIAIVEEDGAVVGYVRSSFNDLADGVRDCIVFTPTDPDHIRQPLFDALVAAQQVHMQPLVDAVDRSRFRAYAGHPGPGSAAVGEAAWLEAVGYRSTEWSASLVRDHLDDVPDRRLPDGVELRPVTEEQIRPIVEAHMEAFRGEWDFAEPTEDDVLELIESPLRDESLWQVAWVGDEVVGQVKPFINHDENAARGYLRGYTEYISTHRDWRNRGIAGALLAMSLRELQRRGMTQAALGVDTNTPGGAFQLYTGLGFRLERYEAVYTKAGVASARSALTAVW